MKVIFIVLLVAVIGIAYASQEKKECKGGPPAPLTDSSHGHWPKWVHRHWHHHHKRMQRRLRKGQCDKYKICQCHEDGKACQIRNNDLKKLPNDQKELMRVVAAKAGPKLAKTVAKLLATLAKVKFLGPVVKPVVKLAVKTIKDCGTIEKLLSGGLFGKAFGGKMFNKKLQKSVYSYLSEIIPSCVACTVTKLLTLLINGKLIGKLPLVKKLLPNLLKLVPSLLKALKGLKKLLKPVKKILDGVFGGKQLKKAPGQDEKLLGIL